MTNALKKLLFILADLSSSFKNYNIMHVLEKVKAIAGDVLLNKEGVYIYSIYLLYDLHSTK
jgi:hypothetical protein